ncbi:duodenase-1-like [Epinephelus moara]|uniref:duodenase-1-like n=1 Tax=Epinephelus moara TaxID=300413 RepID=UPI00214F593E|nr:duodenase-1-like [Epinephelus moara]
MHALYKFLLVHALTCLGGNARGSEIINGQKAPENSMLYMVSLQNSKEEHVCGGFLIREDIVVTAAHCGRLGVTDVVLGTHHLNKAGSRMNIAHRYIHPSFHGEGFGKDIMLLRLAGMAQLNNRVQTIPIPKSEINTQENTMCRVAGWGYTTSGGVVSDDLRVVDVSVISGPDCKEKWPGLPADVICAGGYPSDKGFCQGDSGGPLVCNGMAVGVVSFNNNNTCSYPDVPNVYTDISKYLPWINSKLRH